jgi:RNA polymerase sigma-70 factor, ECF subfamily
MSGLVGGKKAAGKVARSAGVSRTRRSRAGKPSVENGQPDNGQPDNGRPGQVEPGGQAAAPVEPVETDNRAKHVPKPGPSNGRAAQLAPARPPGPASEAALKVLVDRARKGDRFAFDELVRVTWAGTYTLAYRLTGNEEDALDVTQEAYLRALRGLPRFRGEARFSTWLYRVTANCASNHLARSWRARHDQLDPDGMDEASVRDRRLEHDPEASASAGDERALLEQALLRLPWRLRQVVVLRDVYDLSHKAIAAELGTSEAATKVGLQRARKRLREDLGVRLHGPEAPSRRWRRAHSEGKGRPATGPDGTNFVAEAVADMDDDAVAS